MTSAWESDVVECKLCDHCEYRAERGKATCCDKCSGSNESDGHEAHCPRLSREAEGIRTLRPLFSRFVASFAPGLTTFLEGLWQRRWVSLLLFVLIYCEFVLPLTPVICLVPLKVKCCKEHVGSASSDNIQEWKGSSAVGTSSMACFSCVFVRGEAGGCVRALYRGWKSLPPFRNRRIMSEMHWCMVAWAVMQELPYGPVW